MLPKVFISYRRQDTRWAAKSVYDALCRVLPPENIFRDITHIRPGAQFEKEFSDSVGRSDLVLALIGPKWVDIADPKTGRRRLDDPDDPVRMEISTALKRDTIRVVPVLIDGADMPPADKLPNDLQALCKLNAESIQLADFDDAMLRLLEKLGVPIPGGGFRRRGGLTAFENRVASSSYLSIVVAAFVLGFVSSGAESAGLYGLTLGGDIALVGFAGLAYAVGLAVLVASLTRTWGVLRLFALFAGLYILQLARSAILMEGYGYAVSNRSILLYEVVVCAVILVLQWLYVSMFIPSAAAFFRHGWVTALVAAAGAVLGFLRWFVMFGGGADFQFHLSQATWFAVAALLIAFGIRMGQRRAFKQAPTR